MALVVTALSLAALHAAAAPDGAAGARVRIVQGFGALPLSFQPNRGQAAERVAFMSSGGGYTLFLTPGEAVLRLRGRQRDAAAANDTTPAGKARNTGGAVLRMRLVGGSLKPRLLGEQVLAGRSNYFIGDDPARWRTDIPHYAKVRYQRVYRGIDLVFYGNRRRLEYDFVVAPVAVMKEAKRRQRYPKPRIVKSD